MKTEQTNKITIPAIGVTAQAVKKAQVRYNNQKIAIEVTPDLPLRKMGELVQTAVDMVDLPTDKIFPWLIDFAINYAVIVHCTNIMLPEDVDAIWHFIRYSDIVAVLKDTMDYDTLEDCIRQAIETTYFADKGKSQLDLTLIAIKDLVDSVNNKIESLTVQDIAELVKASGIEGLV